MNGLKSELLGGRDGAPPGSDTVREIMDRYGRDESHLLAMLQDVQASFGYLPQQELRSIERGIGVSLTRIYALATFYRAFKLAPRGRNVIRLCTGTACHVRGAEIIREAIERELGIKVGGTTGDQAFSFETVRCLGCCNQAPVLMIGDTIHGKLTPSTIRSVLDRYR